jgi:hypothetical protein
MTVMTKKNPALTSKKVIAKPSPKKKIVLGTGSHLGFISDTLFDEDLNN